MSYDLNHSFAKPIENLPDTKPSLFINRNFIFLFNSFPFLYLVCLISKKSWWNSTKTLVYHGLDQKQVKNPNCDVMKVPVHFMKVFFKTLMKLIWHNLLWYLVFVSRLMLDWWIHIFRHYIVFQNRQVSEAKGHSCTSVDWSRHHCAKRVKAICRLNLCQLHFYGLKLTQAFKTLFQYYWIKDLSFREKT